MAFVKGKYQLTEQWTPCRKDLGFFSADENPGDKLPFIHFMNFAPRPSSLFQLAGKHLRSPSPTTEPFLIKTTVSKQRKYNAELSWMAFSLSLSSFFIIDTISMDVSAQSQVYFSCNWNTRGDAAGAQVWRDVRLELEVETYPHPLRYFFFF